MRVLIVDDDHDHFENLKDQIADELDGCDVHHESDLGNAIVAADRVRPDVVVLDLMQVPRADLTEHAGVPSWRSIWTNRFFPIIIHSGYPGEIDPPVPAHHRFAKRIHRKTGSIDLVVSTLRNLQASVAEIHELRDEVDKVIQHVLRDTAGDDHLPIGDAGYLIHAARRRIAAMMDSSTLGLGRRLQHWELYLVPAIGDSPLLGDILLKRDQDPELPESYLLVLSPSCDLVRDQRPVESVLGATCQGVHTLGAAMQLSPRATKIDETLKKCRDGCLTAGHFNGLLPLPSFGSILPDLIANLKKLEIVPYVDIASPASPDRPFIRRASIDSPFREQIAWAYMSVAGRPGMPDRELDPWARRLAQAHIDYQAEAGAP